jgi:phosphatidylglycerol:prolipoprotein diacylglycerol transferase
VIPYIQIPDIPFLFGLKLHPFGLLVATGVLLGYQFALWQARRLKIPEGEIDLLCMAVVVTGFIGAHWVEAVFYQWDRLVDEGPIYLLKIWDGISSFGGFFGAIVGYVWFIRTRIKGSPLPYLDIAVNGLIIGWVFGRLGCTIAFDHPGDRSDFFLAFQLPDGARHNLGFYEFLYTCIVMVPTIGWLLRKNGGLGPRPGMYTAILILEYVPVRFFWDFFRAQDVRGADTRFLGLTPGHYSALILAALGAWVYRLSRQLPDDYLVQLRDGKVGGVLHPPAKGAGKKKR